MAASRALSKRALHARRVDLEDGLAEVLLRRGHPEPELGVKGTGEPALTREVPQARRCDLRVEECVVENHTRCCSVLELVGLHRRGVDEMLPLEKDFLHGCRGVHDDLEVVGLLDQRAGFQFRVEVLCRDGLDDNGAATFTSGPDSIAATEQ